MSYFWTQAALQGDLEIAFFVSLDRILLFSEIQSTFDTRTQSLVLFVK